MQAEVNGGGAKASEDQPTGANPALEKVADLLADEMVASSRGPGGALWREIRAMTARMVEQECSRRDKAPDSSTKGVAAVEGEQSDERVEAFEMDQADAQLDIQISLDGLGCGDTIYDPGPFTINQCDVKQVVRDIHALICGYRLRHVKRLAVAAGVPDSLKLGSVSGHSECGDFGAASASERVCDGASSRPAAIGRTVRGHRVPAGLPSNGSWEVAG